MRKGRTCRPFNSKSDYLAAEAAGAAAADFLAFEVFLAFLAFVDFIGLALFSAAGADAAGAALDAALPAAWANEPAAANESKAASKILLVFIMFT